MGELQTIFADMVQTKILLFLLLTEQICGYYFKMLPLSSCSEAD